MVSCPSASSTGSLPVKSSACAELLTVIHGTYLSTSFSTAMLRSSRRPRKLRLATRRLLPLGQRRLQLTLLLDSTQLLPTGMEPPPLRKLVGMPPLLDGRDKLPPLGLAKFILCMNTEMRRP